ncbi:MAG: mechanosensitive ion channel family protein [Leucobacter sp.]
MQKLTIFNIEWTSWLGTLLAVGIAVIATGLLLILAHAILVRIKRRAPAIADLSAHIRPPSTALFLVLALWVTSSVTAPGQESWWPVLTRLFEIASVITGAWLLSTLVTFGIQRLIKHDAVRHPTGPDARRRYTQLTLLNRLAVVIIAIIALGVILFSFPEVRAIGTSILASAGVISIIAGVAAQSTLGNLIAGIQIAFSDAVRVGDVVVVEGEWGSIGEINLSYVVVYVWDERRLVLPSTYFTTQPFESWTRRSDQVLGTVYMTLDWRVPIEAVREKYMEVVATIDTWDGRSASALVTDAEGGHVTLRFLASAANSDDQWDLRCQIREQMVTWLQQTHPDALPVSRVMFDEGNESAA